VDTRTINVLSVCSGYGGIELGLHAALDGRTRTIAYVENELSVASILAARMENGSLDQAPVWTDLRTFDPEPWRGRVDILAGGFPCQPHSVAGAQRGEDDPRELSGEVIRIAAGLGYPTLFLENVPGILRFYWDSIRPELREMGYEIAEGIFSASETGAPHKRERLFILAHAEGNLRRTPRDAGRVAPDRTGDSELADADRDRAVRNQSQHREGRGIEQDGEELAHAEQRRIEGGDIRGLGAEGSETLQQTDRTYATDQLGDRNSELDDPEHDGLPAPEEPRGSGSRARHGEAGEIEPEQPTRSGSGAGGDNQLADSDSRLGDHAEEEVCPGGEPSESGSSELAHASIEGLEGIRPTRKAEYQERPGDVPLYPPGPSDHQGWAYMLTVMPQAQPTFCRVVDGASTGVDRRLRAVGNGVVPAVAAKAYSTLSRGLSGRDPESPVLCRSCVR
jgi:DNA (cytosine-5)-methyltransferase 1